MDWSKHQILEKSSILLLIGILITVAIGGLIEIAPLFWLSSTIEQVKGMRPYTPLGFGPVAHVNLAARELERGVGAPNLVLFGGRCEPP